MPMKQILDEHRILQANLVDALRSCGTKACLAKANTLEINRNPMRSIHLRSLDLKASEIAKIADIIGQSGESGKGIDSLSLSYNNGMGDEGCLALASNMPDSVSELGLVDCGITDAGGIKLLEWAKKATNLRMICIEQNNFSDQLKSEFQKFASDNSHLLFVF